MAHIHYSPEIAQQLCDEMASGRSLTEVCALPDMPDRHSVRRWVVENAEFREQYEAARLWWAHSVAEEINTLADQAQEIAEKSAANGGNPNAAVAALRVQIDAKRWMISKILPQQYGDRISQEITGRDGGPLIPEVDESKLALALLTVLRGGRNDPASIPPMAAMASPNLGTPTTLLSARVEPAEPEPVPIDPEPAPTPAMLREHIRFVNVKYGRDREY